MTASFVVFEEIAYYKKPRYALCSTGFLSFLIYNLINEGLKELKGRTNVPLRLALPFTPFKLQLAKVESLTVFSSVAGRGF